MSTGRANQILYCVGDIHGDVQVFLSALHHIGCISNALQILDFIRCHKTTTGALNAPFPRWNNKFKGMVFLMGDVIDNKRGKYMPENIENIEYSEEYLIDACGRLVDYTSRQTKSRFIYIIGNHEMSVVVDNIFEDPEVYRSKYKCNTKRQDVITRRITKSYWKNKLVKHITNYCVPFKMINVRTRINESKYIEYNLAFCHGGLDSKFVDFIVVFYNDAFKKSSFDRNSFEFWSTFETACKTFYDAIACGKEEEIQEYLNLDETSLDWARIHSRFSKSSENHFPFFSMYVVGHSAEESIRIKNLKDVSNTSRHNVEILGVGVNKTKNTSLKAFVDCQLSRAFDTNDMEHNKRKKMYFKVELRPQNIVFEKVTFSIHK